ncbi:DgyrCDS9229 [Dimorphilus gyrociliatus]|uniref:DgyrCDS9229 n=1 Tax=Dimorphilus gyrociliatus TaxID=2664684 RepID=A0A7I8VWR3_9ANNE|nr:DgyrCDS9229 [Dimorphilus gyrociliatus]
MMLKCVRISIPSTEHASYIQKILGEGINLSGVTTCGVYKSYIGYFKNELSLFSYVDEEIEDIFRSTVHRLVAKFDERNIEYVGNIPSSHITTVLDVCLWFTKYGVKFSPMPDMDKLYIEGPEEIVQILNSIIKRGIVGED